MKKGITAMLAGLVLFTGAAFAIEPEDIFLNYGGDIYEGDSMVTASVALPWDMITSDGFNLPTIVAEYEYALPIGPVPFTFGGYAGATGWKHGEYGAFALRVGGLAKYHVAVPPVPGLDIFLGTKLGLHVNMGNVGSESYVGFDWGLDLGASYFFTDEIGISGAVGYPSARIGAIFKL